MQTIKEVLIDISNLVVPRQVIVTNKNRFLYSHEIAKELLANDDYFTTLIIGDSNLSAHIKKIADNLEGFPYCFREELYDLLESYYSDDIEDYISPNYKDELYKLVELIKLAEELLCVEV